MRGIHRWARVIAVAAVLLPTCAFAQAGRAPRSANTRPAVRGFGGVSVTRFSATRSFQAVFGDPTGLLLLGGMEVGLTRHAFISFGVSRFQRTGHRVFVFEGQTFDLRQPTRISITPVELSVGYRSSRRSRLVPYVSGGGAWCRYAETDPRGAQGDDVRSGHAGYQVLGGAEIPVRRWTALAVEAQFSSVPHALGRDPGSVTGSYGEHDLGGLALRVKLVIGR